MSYGQVDPAILAAQACVAMGGEWKLDALECSLGGQTIGLPDFQTPSLPPGSCPSGEVMTPKGCFPIPGGVEPEPPPPPTTEPPPVPSSPPGEATPSWLLPAVVGVGAVAAIALVMSLKK